MTLNDGICRIVQEQGKINPHYCSRKQGHTGKHKCHCGDEWI